MNGGLTKDICRLALHFNNEIAIMLAFRAQSFHTQINRVKIANSHIFIFVLLSFLSGCARNMTERGTWVGKGELVNLYESDGKAVPALALQIDASQLRKPLTVDKEPILVDKHLMLIDPGPYVGKLLRVKGLIYPHYPINPINHKELRAYPTHDPLIMDINGVIKVNSRSIKFVNSADERH